MTEAKRNQEINQRLANLFESNVHLLEDGAGGVLNDARKPAIEAFRKQGIPDFKTENYKYTNLAKIFANENHRRVFAYEESNVNLHELFQCDVPELDTNLVMLTNGWYYSGNEQLTELPEGVVVTSLRKAAVEYPELVEKYYGKMADPEKDPLTALNTAFAQDGVFIYVPRSVVVEKPIQIIDLMRGGENTYATQRNLVIAEENSQVKVIFCDHTLDPQDYMVNNLTEAHVGENAVVDFYNLQNQHNKAVNLTGLYIRQERNSNVLTNTLSLHGGIVRNNLNVLIDGEHAEANLYGLALTDKSQHVDNFTFVEHAHPDCQSNQLFKNVLDDQSTGGFTGRIHVGRGAHGTLAYQRNNNVLLTGTAKMNTKPQLVIDNDDVKCSHGATVGRIDEEALFYLKSRGIAEREARLMLMYAFAHEVLQEVRVEKLGERIDELVNKRLRGEVSKCHSCVMDCES
ncbi:Fe-S cluster assembly protein SufD [Prolixibacter denitrificans]|uniref:Fe-S cluster assembly protein SufD n=1 Tax=Prolixibacter denitrificans TaxID=1541063 RepID=A0A2P8CI72_9BACT|nr:Fe-S cluster assembly protein SufD [Prolixibacter denitrificans]PSK84687.1 Fe-S cluster assembly protein SufD [Prolixibacter denitrificans]GET20853.1 Fe-S cluster assembly protein SufD [Prolixibacter denitrificans]